MKHAVVDPSLAHCYDRPRMRPRCVEGASVLLATFII
jgi:hypothetical protein